MKNRIFNRKNLAFNHTDEARDSPETKNHILSLSQIILDVTVKNVNGGKLPKIVLPKKTKKD